jgi:hypothetical protein
MAPVAFSDRERIDGNRRSQTAFYSLRSICVVRTSVISQYFSRRLRDDHEPTSEADAEIDALMARLMDVDWLPEAMTEIKERARPKA